MEKWDVYDVNKNKIKDRTVLRGTEDLQEGEYHLVTASWVYNSNNEFLMQRRAAHKTYPLQYANHGGCAISGETSKTSMIRELFEETGIKATEDELILLRTFHDHESIFDEYILFKDIGIDDVVFSESEVESCAWFSLEELSRLIDKGDCFDYKNNDPKGVSSLSVISNFINKR